MKKDDKKQKEQEILTRLEKALKDYSNGFQNDKMLEIIAVLLANAPMCFPVDYDINAFLGGINPENLKKGDTVTTKNDVRMKFLTMTIAEQELVPMFTSTEQAEKGPAANLIHLYPSQYLPAIISMNKDFVINPFGESPVFLKIGFLKDMVAPFVKTEDSNDNNSKKQKVDIGVGTVLDGKYELLKQIGKGGTFVVYLALDKRVNKNWTIKVVDKSTTNSELASDMVIKEAEALKRLDHPAIPRIVDVIVKDDYVAIVQDYIEGSTLETIITEYGKQDVANIIDWSIQLCDVLGYLHSLNPPHIYRDMKPANIILKPSGSISLVDFGIMRTYKPNQTKDTTALGTVGFAPPEQFGSAQTDCRSDIYALGMTMYNLFVGKKPNRDGSAELDNEKDSLSKGLVSIIKKSTELNPSDRYQSCYELKAELQYLKDNRKLKKKFSLFSKK